jgi:hypothetical protein
LTALPESPEIIVGLNFVRELEKVKTEQLSIFDWR